MTCGTKFPQPALLGAKAATRSREGKRAMSTYYKFRGFGPRMFDILILFVAGFLWRMWGWWWGTPPVGEMLGQLPWPLAIPLCILWSQWIDIVGVLVFARRAGFSWGNLGLDRFGERSKWALAVTAFCYGGSVLCNFLFAGYSLGFQQLRLFYTNPGMEEFGFQPFGSPLLLLYAVFWSVFFYGMVLETFRAYMYATLYLLFHQNWGFRPQKAFMATVTSFGIEKSHWDR